MTEEERKKREKRLALLLLLLIEETQNHLWYLLRNNAAGAPVTAIQRAAVMQALTAAHTNAAYLGRQAAGTIGAQGRVDSLMGLTVANTQEPYLVGLYEDLLSGRYAQATEGLSPSPLDELKERLGLYAARLYGTANDAWLAHQGDYEDVWWRLDPTVIDHCVTCKSRAVNSPYKAKSMPFVPGDGSTECVTNCKCWLESESGRGIQIFGH